MTIDVTIDVNGTVPGKPSVPVPAWACAGALSSDSRDVERSRSAGAGIRDYRRLGQMDESSDALRRELAALRAELDDRLRAANLALVASEEVNRRMIEAMPGGIVHVASDMAIVTANAEALRILGLSYDEITRSYITDFETSTIWEDGTICPVADYPVAKALRTGQPQPPVTIGVRRPDGQTSWAIFTAVPIHDPAHAVTGAVVTFLDITERKRVEIALRQSEAQLRSILENAPNPIAVTDRDGRIIFINHVGPNLTKTDVIGRFAWEHVQPAYQQVTRDAVTRAIETGETVRYETTGRSGRRYAANVGPIRGAEGITGAAIASWDITELEELQTKAMISDRMASLGTLAAGVAHEINNPLTYTLVNLSLLQRAVSATDAEARTRIAAALEGGERIRSIVRDLSSFSHVGEGRQVALDVHQLLESSIRMADNEIRYRARVVRNYGDVPPVVASDSRLGQVFLNLLVNAAQAIPEGDREANEICVTTLPDDDHVVVLVTDTGIGIPADMLDKIFDPFVTTKVQGVGTGLGLYISRNIVGSLGGELTVTSGPRGSTFRVRLRAGKTSAPDPINHAGSSSSSSRRLRILIVDDEPAIADVMSRLLAAHDTTVANSGRAAISALSAEDYDLVFCDLLMPDLTGMDVFAHLHTHQPGKEARVVFMTGGAFTDRAKQFLATISNDVIEKPFSANDLERVVRLRHGR